MTTNTDKHPLDIPESLKRSAKAKLDKHDVPINTPLSNIPSSGSGANRSSFIAPKSGNVDPKVVTRFKENAVKRGGFATPPARTVVTTGKKGESVSALVRRHDAKEKAKAAKSAAKTKKLAQAKKHSRPVVAKTAAKGRVAGRATRVDPSASIKVLSKENPKREGSKAHARFELYAKCKTVGDFIKKVGDQSLALADISWDRRHDFIRVS